MLGDIELYAGNAATFSRYEVFFHPGGSGDAPMIVLLDDTPAALHTRPVQLLLSQRGLGLE